MQTKIIAVTNQKGGVGKTTSAASILECLQIRGKRVLGIDLDPQGSLSFSMGLDIERCPTVFDVFKGERDINSCISKTETCDMLASNILLSAAEQEFTKAGREFMLKTAISQLENEYDFIIIDTPPALNVLTVNAYVATDGLIIPMAPEVLSLLGVSQIKDTIESVRNFYNSRLQVYGILLNKFNPRLNLNKEVRDLAGQISTQLNTKVFETFIRPSVMVAEAPAHGMSIMSYSPTSKPALDYDKFCDELLADLFKESATSKGV